MEDNPTAQYMTELLYRQQFPSHDNLFIMNREIHHLPSDLSFSHYSDRMVTFQEFFLCVPGENENPVSQFQWSAWKLILPGNLQSTETVTQGFLLTYLRFPG